jgi:diaminopimelate decarboxylase
MESLTFLTEAEVRTVAQEFGTPVFVYDQTTLEGTAAELLAFPRAFDFTARYAMKALPTGAILKVLNDTGLHFDASSGFEAERAIRAGIAPEKIQLTTQQVPENLADLVNQGVLFNACSVNQLDTYGKLFPGTEVSIRVNPGLGSGHNNRTNVGGPSSSFGIWHEQLDEVEEVRAQHNLKITGMHTHVGSGGDPEVWKKCAAISLGIVEKLPGVNRLSLGGGFKVARMPGETSANLEEIGAVVVEIFTEFAQTHGRELHLEIEPGTYVAANAGVLISNVMDVVNTGSEGYDFIKINAGMTEVLRPSHYGAVQPMTLVSGDEREPGTEKDYVIAGHCCESGDILTPEEGDPEGLAPRSFPHPAIGDHLVISGSGAYCSGMASKNYNSFPECPEVLKTSAGEFALIRKLQTMDQMLANEILT